MSTVHDLNASLFVASLFKTAADSAELDEILRRINDLVGDTPEAAKGAGGNIGKLPRDIFASAKPTTLPPAAALNDELRALLSGRVAGNPMPAVAPPAADLNAELKSVLGGSGGTPIVPPDAPEAAASSKPSGRLRLNRDLFASAKPAVIPPAAQLNDEMRAMLAGRVAGNPMQTAAGPQVEAQPQPQPQAQPQPPQKRTRRAPKGVLKPATPSRASKVPVRRSLLNTIGRYGAGLGIGGGALYAAGAGLSDPGKPITPSKNRISDSAMLGTIGALGGLGVGGYLLNNWLSGNKKKREAEESDEEV